MHDRVFPRWLPLVLALIHTGAAAQDLAFEDRTEAAGLAGVTGYGVAVADYDGDGWDDLLVTTATGGVRLFHNEGNLTFTDRTGEAGLPSDGRYFVPLWGDVDNDGFPDLFLGRKGTGTNRLFHNQGNGTFVDRATPAGLAPEADVAAATFGDYDGDGWIDLFLAVEQTGDLLYHNLTSDGVLRFEDQSGRAGVAGPAYAVPMQATWLDVNHDARPDLFAVHDGAVASRLYLNEGFLPLRDVAHETGLDDVGAGNSMGIAWGDIDHDGWEEVYVTRIGRAGLYRQPGDGVFTDEAVERGVDRNGMAWGTVFADFDNDADLDLYVVNTSGYDGSPAFLYANDGTGHFTELAEAAGVALVADAYGVATADFDRDGRVDLVVGAGNGVRLYRNTSPSGGHWVALRLEGRTVNRMALGTRVEVVAGGRRLTRTVSGGDSFCSQTSPTLHVGLGSATRIDTLHIYWGAGRVQTLTDLDADRLHTLLEPITATATEPLPDDTALQLLPGHPNPSHGETTLAFTLPAPSDVRLTLHDLLGRTVAVIAEGTYPAGLHRITFGTANLPAGVYLTRLRAGAHLRRGSLILVR